VYEYGSRFFDHVTAGAADSARVLIPILREQLNVASVLDVGCGQGAWLKVWGDHGVDDVVGIDGLYVDQEALLIEPSSFVSGDLNRTIRLERNFDLVQCLEVAEHLQPEASNTLVENLVAHGSVLLFSAAPPGQGGEHHVNEQPPAFWRDLFLAHGYVMLDFVRPRLAGRKEVASWYRYNTFLFVERKLIPTLSEPLRASMREDEEIIPRVEPLLYRVRCQILRRLPQRWVDAIAHLVHRLSATSRSFSGGLSSRGVHE
jgi:SAM-dependent methyltransferase